MAIVVGQAPPIRVASTVTVSPTSSEITVDVADSAISVDVTDNAITVDIADNAISVDIADNAVTADISAGYPVALIQDFLRVDGSNAMNATFTTNVTTVITTTHTAGAEHIINVDDDTAGADVTIDLPAVASSDGLIYYIKKTGDSYDVIIDAASADEIDGATTATLTSQYESVMLACDGTSWSIY